MRSSPRNDYHKLRAKQAQKNAISDEDLIVDFYFDVNWQSDLQIKVKLFGIIPVSLEDLNLTAKLNCQTCSVLDSGSPKLQPAGVMSDISSISE